MNNDASYAWIVSHQQNYPGKHQSSQSRTSEAVKPLDPKSQFHLVIRSLGEYIRENMMAGRGLNYHNFGAFAFEIETQLVKPAQNSNFDITKDLGNQRALRMHNHKIKPCFVPDNKLHVVLTSYPGKQEIIKPKSQYSNYQKGFNMIFCNIAPIAASCELDKDVVESLIETFARAVTDLAELDKSLDIIIGPCKISFNNKHLTYKYDSNFESQLNNTQQEKNVKKSLKQTKEHWLKGITRNGRRVL